MITLGDKIDEILHDHGNWLMPIFILMAAIVALAIGFITTGNVPPENTPQVDTTTQSTDY